MSATTAPFVDPWVAFGVVAAAVTLGCLLLGSLGRIDRRRVDAVPPTENPPDWRKAA